MAFYHCYKNKSHYPCYRKRVSPLEERKKNLNGGGFAELRSVESEYTGAIFREFEK